MREERIECVQMCIQIYVYYIYLHIYIYIYYICMYDVHSTMYYVLHKVQKYIVL